LPDQAFNVSWKAVVGTIQDGLMVLDKAGTIISVNKALEPRKRVPSKQLAAGIFKL
jgi:hypothetical protein